MAQYEITNEAIPIDFECDNSILQRTLQNAKNLLMCRMGEVPFDRMRGVNPALYDLPMEEMLDKLLPELDRVMLWEPDVEVAAGYLTINDAGETVIHCIVQTEVK